MMETEKGIFADLWKFLNTYIDPPGIGEASCVDFWRRADNDLIALIKKWHEHPLAKKLGMALLVYLEDKSKDGGKDVQEQ